MSAHLSLSPPKPIRTRFKVPGEGSYSLLTTYAPPPPPTPPTYSTTQSSAPKPPPPPTPLGLPKVTKLSIAPDASLVRPETSLFSLRKLTQLAKFGAEEGDVAVPPRVAVGGGGVMSYNVGDTVMLCDFGGGGGGGGVTPRSLPTAHALGGGGGKVLVGCLSGEVYVYDTAKRAVLFQCLAVNSRCVSVLWGGGGVVSVHENCLVVYDMRYKQEERCVPKTVVVNEVVVEHRKKSGSVVWHLGVGVVTSACFSRDGKMLAISSRDGFTRVIDWEQEKVVWAFRSYFGAVLCCAFSADGKWLAAGGEDDLVSIFDPVEGRLIARLEGHTSWISAVAWDDFHAAPQYRLASAGQDTKLLLWDFCLDSLHGWKWRSEEGRGRVNGVGIVSGGWKDAPLVEPVVAHLAHGEPLTDVVFGGGGIVTADGGGGVKVWTRPPAAAIPKLTLGKSGRPLDLD